MPGSSVAAPIARDIILHALYEGLPALTAYPEDQRLEIRSRLNEFKDINGIKIKKNNFDRSGTRT